MMMMMMMMMILTSNVGPVAPTTVKSRFNWAKFIFDRRLAANHVGATKIVTEVELTNVGVEFELGSSQTC